MRHLPFPFEQSAWLVILNEKQAPRMVEAEVASSVIEIYQALSYRSANDFYRPLVAIFQSEDIKYSMLSDYPFPVEMIAVKLNFKVQERKILNGSDNCEVGSYTQKFQSFNCVVLAPKGFVMEYKIKDDSTHIHVFEKEPSVVIPRFMTDPYLLN